MPLCPACESSIPRGTVVSPLRLRNRPTVATGEWRLRRVACVYTGCGIFRMCLMERRRSVTLVSQTSVVNSVCSFKDRFASNKRMRPLYRGARSLKPALYRRGDALSLSCVPIYRPDGTAQLRRELSTLPKAVMMFKRLHLVSRLK